MHDQRRQDGRSCKDAGCLRRLLPRHCNDNTASVGYFWRNFGTSGPTFQSGSGLFSLLA